MDLGQLERRRVSEDWRWCLREFGWLDELSELEIAAIPPAGRCSDVAPGVVVFAPERSPDSVFLLRSGLVRMYRLSRAGDELSLGFVGPQEIFGEQSGFSGFPRESYAITVTPCRIYEIPQDTFLHLVENHARLLLEITNTISRRAKRIEGRLAARIFHDAFARTCALLFELCEDFGRRIRGGTLIDAPMTQSELASLMGSVRQTVSPHIRRLEEMGAISRRRGCWLIEKPEELERLASGG